MIDISGIDYTELDIPQVLMVLFHPRPEYGRRSASEQSVEVMIPVEAKVEIGARFHIAGLASPNILFFHGNGEIVADYDDMAPFYTGMNINFLAVDYRGYGRSGGQPTVTHMMRDCHIIFQFVRTWLDKQACSGPLLVMGRSLGSASALELAANYRDQIDGLIIESGFAWAEPLLALLGVETPALKKKGDSFSHTQKIKAFNKPTLIIHAEYDHIIPFTDGLALFEASPAREKFLLKIPGANHNDIFFRGLSEYLAAIKALAEKIMDGTRP
ncbi:MAG: alpha/beta hydrolase [Pseudomonadota bacterium]